MNSTTWTAAPAGNSRPGSIGMPLCACSAAAGLRLRPIDERGMTIGSYLAQAPAMAGRAPLSATRNVDTTLGIHSPGRPQS